MQVTTPSRIAASLIQDGPTHRADLARRLSLSRTAISRAVDGLLEQHLVMAMPRTTDTPTLKDKMCLTPRFGLIASIAIDFDRILVGVGTLDGRLLASRVLTSGRRRRGEQLVREAAACVRELHQKVDGSAPLLLAHLAVNTQADRETGAVLGATASAAWSDINPKHLLEAELGTEVRLENTSRLLALAEQRGRPHVSDLMYVQLSYGVAMGLVVDGQILGGSRGGAGELGHLSIDLEGRPCSCEGRGCLMQYIGRDALAAEVAQLLGEGADVPDLNAVARTGDAAAIELLAEFGRRAGAMLTGPCNLFEPTTLVIGGCLSEAGELFLGPLRDALRARALPLAVDGLSIENATSSLDPVTVLRAGLRCLRLDPMAQAAVVSRSLSTTHTRQTQKV